MATDIGIELGKIFYKKTGGSSSVNVQFYKLYLYISLLTAFLFGGVLGAILFKNLSYLAVMPFSLILVMCSISPILEDISKSKKS